MNAAQREPTAPSFAPWPIPPLRSLLESTSLLAYVQHEYRLGPVRQCTLLRSLTNDVYDVWTSDRRNILKVYGHGWRSLGEISWEIDLLAHLAAKGLPIAGAIPRADGQTIGAIQAPEGLRGSVLFAYLEGTKPAGPSADLYHEFGDALARIHLAAEDFRSRHPRRPLDVLEVVDQSLAVVSPHLANRPEDRAYVERLANRARERVTSLGSQHLTRGVCHGDVSLDNIHVGRDGRINVYDFDSAGHGWQASDFSGVMTWLIREHPDFWDAFLRGYQKSRLLTKADLEALTWLVPISLLDNMRFHLTSWVQWRGALALDERYVDREMSNLRRWDQQVLCSDGAGE